MSVFISSPVNHWQEESTQRGGLGFLTGLVPYKRTDGFWEFAERGSGPGGSTQGALVRSGEFDALTTSTTTGLGATRSPAGFLFFY